MAWESTAAIAGLNAKIYPNVTHAYLHQQTLGENAAATLDSWTRAVAFFKRYLS
jgi:dienelactone hydrolase